MPILVWTLSGCVFTDPTESTSFMQRYGDRSISPDCALLLVALIECPFGDASNYINERLWEHTDELFVDLERHAALDENGFRIGQLVGTPPDEFQQMLLDKKLCRQESRIFPASRSIPLTLSSILPESSYEIVHGGARSEVSLKQAQFFLDVSAQFMSDGRTKLTFTPRVDHGEAVLPFRAAPERSTWVMQTEKAAKKYPELSWDVTLGQNQHIIIGARPERDGTLGVTALTPPEGQGSQRLLVIRNCRSVAANDARQNSVEELVRTAKTPPLALQASMPTYRGKTP